MGETMMLKKATVLFSAAMLAVALTSAPALAQQTGQSGEQKEQSSSQTEQEQKKEADRDAQSTSTSAGAEKQESQSQEQQKPQ
jgi:hypothetical protein